MTDSHLYETGKESLKRSLAIQGRVIHALLMREMITRYGRDNIGFLWMFAEPMLFVGGMALLRSALGRGTDQLPLIPFIWTGWFSFFLWRNVVTMCMNGIPLNKPLLFHRNVNFFDIFYTRMILEGAAVTVSFILLFFIFASLGWMTLPDDVVVILIGWFLLFWLGCGSGLLVAVIADRFEPFRRMWGVITLAFMMTSGIFFMVDWLPTEMQEMALWLPIVNCIEMIREGYFGPQVVAHYSVSYVVFINTAMLFIGLLAVKRTQHILGTKS